MRDYLADSVVEAYAALKSLTKSTNREKESDVTAQNIYIGFELQNIG